MYYIDVKEQFDVVRFMTRAPIFSRQGFSMFQVRSVSEVTFRVRNILSSFSDNFYSAIEIGLYFLYRKNVIGAFKLNEKIVRSRYSFSKRKRQFVSRKPSRLEKATILFMSVRTLIVRDILRCKDTQRISEKSN